MVGAQDSNCDLLVPNQCATRLRYAPRPWRRPQVLARRRRKESNGAGEQRRATNALSAGSSLDHPRALARGSALRRGRGLHTKAIDLSRVDRGHSGLAQHPFALRRPMVRSPPKGGCEPPGDAPVSRAAARPANPPGRRRACRHGSDPRRAVTAEGEEEGCSAPGFRGTVG